MILSYKKSFLKHYRNINVKTKVIPTINYNTTEIIRPESSIYYKNNDNNIKFIRYENKEAPSLTELKILENVKSISDVKIDSYKHKMTVNMKNGEKKYVNIEDNIEENIINDLVQKNIKFTYENNYPNIISNYILTFFINFILPSIIFIALAKILFSRNNNISSFTQSTAKYQEIPDTGVTFRDVAGCDNAKQDLQEIVDFLKNPEKYSKLGASIPKGCLLIGSPGTGKTLLAKAISGEAGVPFFSCSGSSFVEMFVGTGSARVRDLFKKASEKAPCIIFIDEIDAIGKARGGIGGLNNNDEREQTINQLLTEMDGFDSKKAIIILAATNRPEILDPALTRPGRFDRKIIVEKPDYLGRIAIMKIHTQNKPLDDDIDIEKLCKVLAGSSGADIQNLANEAAILAARRNAEKITMNDFENAIDKISIGDERKTVIMSEQQKLLTSVHELGHTIVSLNVGDYDKLKKVTIIPRGLTGGVTVFEPSDDRIDMGLYTKEYLENQLCVALGGRVAEELVFGSSKITTGASSDLQQVSKIARKMVVDFGFSSKLGPVSWKVQNSLNGEDGYSQQTGYYIDEEIKKIVNSAYNRTVEILNRNIDLLNSLAKILMEKETLSAEEVENYIKNFNKNNINNIIFEV